MRRRSFLGTWFIGFRSFRGLGVYLLLGSVGLLGLAGRLLGS